MPIGYRAALALTSLLLLAGAHAAAKQHPRPQRGTLSRPAHPPTAEELYSSRALRQARIILQLKLLELRRERLERVREVLERRAPLDDLLKLTPPDAIENLDYILI